MRQNLTVSICFGSIAISNGLLKKLKDERTVTDALVLVTSSRNGAMQTVDALLQRRSAKTLTEPGPDEEVLELILKSAARAPDHGHLRPWRFIVIQGAGRKRFGDLLADYLRRTHPTVTEDVLHRESQKAFRAPLIVVVAAICDPVAKVPVIEQIISTGAAAQNIMLATFALGFNAMWKTGGLA